LKYLLEIAEECSKKIKADKQEGREIVIAFGHDNNAMLSKRTRTLSLLT
jgi:hypothetical protein